MPRRKYDREQQAILDKLAAVHREQVVTKADMRAEIEAAFRARLAEFDVQKSLLANQAVSRGVAKSDVQRAISSGNWDTLRKLLDLTAAQFVEESTEVREFTYNPESQTIAVDVTGRLWDGYGAEGVTGQATFAVRRFTGEFGASHIGEWHARFVSGDEKLRRMEADRPYAMTHNYWQQVAREEGWDI